MEGGHIAQAAGAQRIYGEALLTASAAFKKDDAEGLLALRNRHCVPADDGPEEGRALRFFKKWSYASSKEGEDAVYAWSLAEVKVYDEPVVTYNKSCVIWYPTGDCQPKSGGYESTHPW